MKSNFHLDGIRQQTVCALEKIILSDDRIDEIENRDMDEGRFFVHLKEPYYYDLGYAGAGDVQRTQSFGSAGEVKYVLKNNVRR